MSPTTGRVPLARVFVRPGADPAVARIVAGLNLVMAAMENSFDQLFPEGAIRTCRKCGCTDTQACVDPATGEACHWVGDDLCSACPQ